MRTESEERLLLAAQGYCELGMFDEALGELDELPKSTQRIATSVEMRLVILMKARRWAGALPAARELCRVAPDRNIGYIHYAFCLHELGKTNEARDVLLAGPQSLHSEPTFHYNLACYECRLGNLNEARAHLDRSFQLDKKFREFAKTDTDLDALRAKG